MIRAGEGIEGGIDARAPQRIVEEVRLPDRDDLVAIAMNERGRVARPVGGR